MEKKKQFGKYYIGLDIGTDSIGWAVTDTNYELQKFNQKSMWGSRLFPEAQTAVDRRVNRVARRRIQRRNQRLALLQDLFKDEVCKNDPQFFARLSESMLHAEDKTVGGKNSLFGDSVIDDKAYHKKYPTIYHLRSELIHSDKPHDVRLVYLAIHHIMKYRGHFLFEGSLDTESTFDNIMKSFCEEVEDSLGIPFDCSELPVIKEVLCNRGITRTEKQKKLFSLFDCKSNSQTAALLKMINGSVVKLKDVFPVGEESEEEIKIEFGSDSYDQLIPKLEVLLADDYSILSKAKAIHDWALLEGILHGKEYLSDAKKDIYDQHAKDLRLLKKLIRRYCPNEYDSLFKDPSDDRNYCAYVGVAKVKGKKVPVVKSCTQADFCKRVKSTLEKIKADDPELEEARARLSSENFMPKLRTKDNSVVPNQLHLKELKKILQNAEKYLPFLKSADQDGTTVEEKILQILTFRIPYYVGPLNDRDPKAQNTWVVRRSHEKIYPWNFDEIVDREMSAAAFITRMTAQCTYLNDHTVLPQNSLLYTRFMVLNELNNLKIDGEPISVSLKQDIYRDCFETHSKVSMNVLLKYLKTRGMLIEKDQVTGIDGDFKGSLKVWREMRDLLGDCFTIEIAEEIVRLSTLLGEDRKMFCEKLRKEFRQELPEEVIIRASGKRYTGWGRLSKEFLTCIHDDHYDPETAEYPNIITALWESNENLMQLLGGSHGFAEAVRKYNETNSQDYGFSYQTVKDLYLSPSIRRSVWQTLRIVKEIRGITGHDPEKVFVEMARGGGEKNKRTQSRKSKLLELYRSCKDETRDWMLELNAREDSDYRSDRLYLYYTQMGRCMYTGESIDLDHLFDANVYDVDHIFPQSKVKDDSIDNRVLVKRVVNAEKTDVYPIDKKIRNNMHSTWSMLLQKGFISKKKYDRLLRGTKLTDDELSDFVSRQLVETRQSTKAVADILGHLLPDTEVVYVKASLVSDFRKEYDLLKCREVNDLHHGKDAYLNIVVGNVYNTKFTKDPRNFFREQDHTYSLNKMYQFPVRRGETVAWQPGESGSITVIKSMMRKNNVLVTQMVVEKKGQLFDLNPVRKNHWQLPLKKGMACLADPSKYGGYNNVKGAYFMMVESIEKGKARRSIVDMPIHLAGIDPEDPAVIEMLVRDKGLNEPRILVPHIGINSIIEIDGCRMYLTGRTGTNLDYALAHQLILGYENELYLRNILKYCDRDMEYSHTHRNEELKISEYDGLSAEENLKLYDLFVSKLENTVYRVRLSAQAENLKKARGRFEELSVEKQCKCLKQALNLFTCNKVKADLSIIGLGSQLGSIRTARCISNYESVWMINQSVTGLFESRSNLLS